MNHLVLTPETLFQEIAETDYFCGEPQQSYSPFFSSIGMIADRDSNGIGALLFHYNRTTRAVFRKVIDFQRPYNRKASDFTHLVCGENELALSFFGKNSFVVSCKSNIPVAIFSEPDPSTDSFWFDLSDPDFPLILGYSANPDDRDPDEKVPFAIMLHSHACKYSVSDDTISFYPNESDEILFSAVIELLEYDTEHMKNRLTQAPESITEAVKATSDWAMECVKDFNLTVPEQKTADAIRFSIIGLLFNLTQAEGLLKYHLSSFPSRGTYPTHFLWDTCFQNLAYESMNLSLAEDLILQNITTQRADGKYEQFLCSTWTRPHDSQPALIGWAAYRLAKKTKNHEFINVAIPSLIQNTNWWLTQRGTDCGLIYTLGGLETGQDNSPRFDNGPTIAVDMNAFLLHQMNCIARLAEMNGDEATACEWDRRAFVFAKKIRQFLYDNERHIFLDLDLNSRQPVTVLSPSGLLPLWAGNVLREEEAKLCIRKHLLNPDSMFGKYPFPSISYLDPTFDPSDWWRGPVWLPIAYLMLECLEKYGFHKEKQIAAERMYQMTRDDGEMHELFDALSGKGMGAAQQGWTCAVFIRLIEMLNASSEYGENIC